MINLLQRLKAALDLSYLFVAHDLALVRHVADRVAVMYRGTIVEIGDVERVYRHPAHPYTRALLAAMPVPDPDVERGRRRSLRDDRPSGSDLSGGETPDSADPPSGCRYRAQCPRKATLTETERRRCADESPALRHVSGLPGTATDTPTTDHASACHFGERPPVTTV